MMNEDEKLNRLIQMATSGGAEAEVPPMAAKFPAEVVRRAWRRSDEGAREKCWLAGVRWGMAGAALIMIASVLINVRALRSGTHVNAEAVFHQHLVELLQSGRIH